MSTTTTPQYTGTPVDACQEAAARLNVVLSLLEHHKCIEDDESVDSSGGYDLSVMRETLEAIRNLLHQAAAEKQGEVQ